MPNIHDRDTTLVPADGPSAARPAETPPTARTASLASAEPCTPAGPIAPAEPTTQSARLERLIGMLLLAGCGHGRFRNQGCWLIRQRSPWDLCEFR